MSVRAPLVEAADSLVKASTPEPFSTSRTSNWVARAGGLPPYVQHIAHDLMEKRGKSESQAIQMAIGIVKRWARGGGNVDATTRAAAAKAVAEWEAKRAKAHAASAVQHSAGESFADELALREAALGNVALLEGVIGTAGMIRLLEGEAGRLQEASSGGWSPTFKRTATAAGEVERHEVHDGAQHVGTITRRRSYDRANPDRWSAFAVNGSQVAGYAESSRSGAVDALRKHLEEAPARVVAWPTAGKFLVARPSSYSGETTYASYPSEAAARHAAGLPAAPTVPEAASKVAALAEGLFFDLCTLSAVEIPPLRRVQEVRRRFPLAGALAEGFRAGELRDFRGRWRAGTAHHVQVALGPESPSRRPTGPFVTNTSYRARSLSPAALPVRARPRPRVAPTAATRYEGGVTRASARARAAHAAKPQIALATDKHPERALAAAVGHGSWDSGAAAVTKRLLAQPQMVTAEIEREAKAGRAVDTEKAHRTGPRGAYSPERQALHEHLLSLLLQGKGTHDGEARAIFTAGGGASGKSGLVSSGRVKVPHDAVIANPDVIRAMLPEYKALKAAGREDAAALTHEETSHLAKVLTRLALGRQHHVLVDGTGDGSPGKFAGKVRAAQSAGHHVSVHYATIPTAEAIKRSDKRGERSGRFVDHGVLRRAHKAVSANFHGVREIPGIGLEVFDTTTRTPELLASRAPTSDKLVIANARGFRGFLAKANEKG